ncbi:hypothetical protein Agub_g15707 [Astrephomene gubernaculifera]|uniref:Peptidase A1 domain-containing protein n=1 Tax=Astrephomene gubernaculifera TaxID=47775 RepID=A0AAD3HUE4_9CHLO|nr:hypothetical protein Agub_g15707 [Astrephomene gubernaculifera]
MLLGLVLIVVLAASQGHAAGIAVNGTGFSRRVLRQPGGFVVPLRQREQPSSRRHLLRSGVLPVQGAVREVGYFYTTLKLGTPARTFSVIIDTGSTITYIPCKGCAHCGKHQDEWFDPDASSTAKKLGCKDPLCNCGSPSCWCKESRCYYSRTYAEKSSSEGWMIEDAFGFPDDEPPVRMVFGCENGETGEIYRQMADGIMGMGNNNNAFQSQLVARGVIEDVFSLCFGYPKDGLLLLGDVAMPNGSSTIYTELKTNTFTHYYNVKMDSITVDGQSLGLDRAMFDRGYGVVLDSGTTFTYLPTDAFKAMSAAIGKYAEAHGLQRTPGADPQYNDICWKGARDGFQGLEEFFPPAEFVFAGNARLTLPPLRYLFLSRPSEYCLGFFDNGAAGTLIGGVSVRDVVVTYDRRKSRVGFTAMPCGEVASALEARAAAAPANQPAANAPAPAAVPTNATAGPAVLPPAIVANVTKVDSEPNGDPSSPPAPPYHAQLATASSGNFGTIIIVVVLAVVLAVVVAEVVFFRRSKLRDWLVSLWRPSEPGAQDASELTSLVAGEKVVVGTSTV